jgi:hypothetical protein
MTDMRSDRKDDLAIGSHIARSERSTSRSERATALTPLEEAQLRRLVNQAWELKDSPYYRDAINAICDWHYDTLPDRLERANKTAA